MRRRRKGRADGTATGRGDGGAAAGRGDLGAPDERGGERARELWRAAGLACGPLAVLGIARFAYALLLPPMRADLAWTYTEAGAMNTANALGYLAGAVSATWLIRRLDVRRLFLAGLAVAAICVLACAAVSAFWLLAILRLVAGAAGAVTFVAGAALATQAGARLPAGRATAVFGIYVAGSGAGIVLSGIAVPPLLAATSAASGWRLGWLLLGVVAAAAFVPAAVAARGVPDLPAGTGPAPRRWPRRRLLPTAVAYTLFGIGYVGYSTFVVALLAPQIGAALVAVFWALLGAAAVVASFAWPPLLARARGGRGPALVLAVVAAGAVLPVVTSGAVAALGSALLFGCAFLSTVTGVTVVVRRALPPHAWGSAIAELTVGFAIGQCAGPLLSGLLSDQGGLRAGLAFSAVLLGIAALVALAQSDEGATSS